MISLSLLPCEPQQARRPRVLQYSARAAIECTGGADSFLYEIRRGSVMLYRMQPQGRRQILDVLEAGDFYDAAAGASAGLNAQTLCDTELIRHAKSALAADVSLQARVAARLVAHQNVLHAHMQLLATPSAADRIAGLLAMQLDLGRQMHLSITEIADYLGLRMETVSRQYARLAKAGIVTRSRWGSYVVKDAEGLRRCVTA